MEAPRPRPEDVDELHALLDAHGEVLDLALKRVRAETGLVPTGRLKNTGTLLDKLRRQGGSWLKSVYDLAGMRIVGDFDRPQQDTVVADLVEVFAQGARPPRVIDRRADPVQGYRAVHVIVFPEGLPVEIQVRTRWQHEWAELFEKLADRVGRGIRYGDALDHWATAGDRAGFTDHRRALYNAEFALRQTTVRLAIVIADLVAVVEEMTAAQGPHDPEVIAASKHVELELRELRAHLDDLEADTI